MKKKTLNIIKLKKKKKKVEHWRIDAFELWCWRRLLRVPWTTRRTNTPILKEINPEYSLEVLMLKLKLMLQYFGLLMWRAYSLEKPWSWERWKAGGEGDEEDKMFGWHHQLKWHEFEHVPGDSEGQRSLACCSPWGREESDMTEWLNSKIPLSTHLICSFIILLCPMMRL